MRRISAKKIILLSLVSVLILTLLIGCTSKDNEPASSNRQEEGKQETITLRFSWWGGDTRHKATLEAIELYMELNPHVKIEGEYGAFDTFYQKLLTQLSGKTAPDIIQVDPSWINDLLMQGDMFVDINELTDWIDISGFDQEFMNNWGFINGKLQGIPTGLNVYTTIVNKTLMEQLDIPVKKEWTWESILEVGTELHQQDNSFYLLNQEETSTSEKIIMPYHAQLTGRQLVNSDFTIGFDKESMTQTLTYLKSLYDNGVLQPLGESSLFNDKTEQNPKWINGESAMTLAYSSDITKHVSTASQFEITTTRFPILDGAEDTGIVVRPPQFISINKDTEHLEEAAKFVNWFYNDKDSILINGVERSVPAMASAQQLLLENDRLDETVAESVQTAVNRASSTPNYIVNNRELMQILNEVIGKIAFSRSTPEEAAEELLERYEAKLIELAALNNK